MNFISFFFSRSSIDCQGVQHQLTLLFRQINLLLTKLAETCPRGCRCNRNEGSYTNLSPLWKCYLFGINNLKKMYTRRCNGLRRFTARLVRLDRSSQPLVNWASGSMSRTWTGRDWCWNVMEMRRGWSRSVSVFTSARGQQYRWSTIKSP
jgi:hypothetical protein